MPSGDQIGCASIVKENVQLSLPLTASSKPLGALRALQGRIELAHQSKYGNGAPIPSASVKIVVMVNAGALLRRRTA
jgi:hypothetical protein